MIKPLILAVVGHTNVGKTSLLRTLTRDARFGEVSDRPSTTRHVEGARLSVNNNPLIELYDTPGLEDSIDLLDYIEQLQKPEERIESPQRLQRFLTSTEAKNRFEQEAKVIRQLFNSDAGLYIIDVREPVLAKYRDELQILRDSGKPLLPIFNFVASQETKEEQWKQLLSALGLHAVVRFDTISPPIDGEKRLYESLALLIESARPQLEQLITELKHQRTLRHQNACKLIAETLIDTAAYSRLFKSEANKMAGVKTLQSDIRQRENRCIDDLLTLYKFNTKDAQSTDLPLFNGRFAEDLFSVEALKQMGVRLSKGVAAGAVAGAGIDLAVGGLTMGAATTIGAILGGVSLSIKHYGPQLMGLFTGGYKLSVNDEILSLLAIRLLTLQQLLDNRGHAAQHTITIEMPTTEHWQTGRLPTSLNLSRAHPEWSSLNPEFSSHSTQHNEVIQKLANELLSQSLPTITTDKDS